MGTLDGKVIVVTGAAMGMGASHATMCSDEGAQVVLTDISDTGAAFAASLAGETLFVRHDVANEQSWSDVVAQTVERFGRIDGLVNNAGVMRPQLLVDSDFDEYLQVIAVNQHSVYLGMRSVAPVMAQGGGSIVNISSIAGLNGSVGTFAYTASKWAVRGMTKAAALELAPSNIRVNSVHPGTVDTPMIQAMAAGSAAGSTSAMASRVPLGRRLAEPAEVSNMVVYLLSDKSSMSTGSEFVVDGGKSCGIPQ